MFTWINRPAGGLALLALTACGGIDLAGPSRAVSVQGGAISVTPPSGYCASQKVAADDSGNSVVLMGRCSAASRAQPALITASIGADGSGGAMEAGPVALTSFFTSPSGRAMLASSGDAKDAIVQASEIEDGAVVLRIKDTDLGDYWRAILALKGRLVMLSATGAGDVGLPAADGRSLISKSMSSLRRANAEKGAKTGLAGLFSKPPQASSGTPASAP